MEAKSMPLDGMRVIDLTDDSGRFATRLLSEMGADVVRVTADGSPGHPMSDPRAAQHGGVLDWWYDGGKQRAVLDLDTKGVLRFASPRARELFDRLAGEEVDVDSLQAQELLPAKIVALYSTFSH